MKKLSYVLKNVSELSANPRNARTHNKKQIDKIANSIKEFGFIAPAIIDGAGILVAGHGRLEAAKKIGMKEIPCIIADHLSPEQLRAYMLADNRIQLDAGWDEEMLKVELNELSAADFDVSFTGFDESEISGHIRQGAVEGEDDAPAPEENPVSKLGDIWILGDHRVMCGDSTDADTVAKLMDGQMADLWLTDPPYNVAYEGKTKDALKIDNDQMTDENFRQFLNLAFSSAKQFLKDGGVFYIWHADMEGYNFRGACFDAGLKVRQCLVWLKNSMVLGRQDYQWKHEPCLYGWKDGAAHYWANDRKQTTILEFERPQRNGEHPTMKPVALFEYQVLNNTKEGEIVLDNFGGSGTTAIACEKTARLARLMELDPKYVDVIVKRWQDFTGKKAVHAETGKLFDDQEIPV